MIIKNMAGSAAISAAKINAANFLWPAYSILVASLTIGLAYSGQRRQRNNA